MSENELAEITRGQGANRDSAADPAGHSRLMQQSPAPAQFAAVVSFDRRELRDILNLYGRKVAEGEWRDYAIDFSRDRAVFSIFRRASEVPLYRIEKDPKLARRQGAFSVTNAAGLVLRRGQDLARVLGVLDKGRLKLV